MGNNDQAKNAKIFFGIFCLFIGLVSAFGGNQIEKIKKAHLSTLWPSSEGKIISSEVESKTSSTRGVGHGYSTSYFANIAYEYSVGGKKYTYKRISYGDYGSSDRVRTERIINSYSKDEMVRVYYNPADPSESVLERGASLPTYIPLGIGIIFSLSGVMLLYKAAFKK